MKTRLLLVFFLALCQFGIAAEPQRPNILFCFADDWGRYAGVYGAHESRPSPNQIVKTPNIDRVAQRGVLFKNAFVNAPSCTPCRSSLLSGRYFFNTGRGAILQGAVWDSSIPTWPLLLRESGYHIGKSFKVWSPGTPADAPFGGQQFAYQQAGALHNNFSENVTKMVGEGTPLAVAREKMLGEVRGNFDAFLTARKAGQPWLYWFGPTTVHRTWVKGSGKKLWAIEPDSLKGRLPKFIPDVPEMREDFADYLGEVQAFDAYIGALLKKLEEAGELNRTLIVISGDHGAPGFPGGKCNLYDFGIGVALAVAGPGIRGGRVAEDFVSLPDLAPTFLEVGGAKLPPDMNSRSLLNVLRSDKSGQVDPTRTSVIAGRERHVGMAREGNLPYPHRALRTKDFLYIRNFAPDRWPMGSPHAVTPTSAPSQNELEFNTRACFPDMDAGPAKAWLIAHRNDPQWKWHYDYAFGKRPGEELYDLAKDPDQIQNIAAIPAYADKRKELSEQLMKVLKDAGDPRVTGVGDTFDKPPFSDPENLGAGKKGPKKKGL
ncbi:MAG: sulfatase [Pedosphaera sp.]|nr:sulfatase [Pedosphaera sp.]